MPPLGPRPALLLLQHCRPQWASTQVWSLLLPRLTEDQQWQVSDKPRLWLQVASRCLTPLPMIWSPKNHIAGSHTRQTAEPCSRERQPCPWRHKQTTHYRPVFHNHSVGTPVHTLTFTRHTPSAAHSSTSPQTTFCTLFLSFLHTR